MTDRAYQFCEKHPKEPIAYCDLCLHEMRLRTRQEAIDMQRKMDEYREAILGPDAKKRDTEWP